MNAITCNACNAILNYACHGLQCHTKFWPTQSFTHTISLSKSLNSTGEIGRIGRQRAERHRYFNIKFFGQMPPMRPIYPVEFQLLRVILSGDTEHTHQVPRLVVKRFLHCVHAATLSTSMNIHLMHILLHCSQVGLYNSTVPSTTNVYPPLSSSRAYIIPLSLVQPTCILHCSQVGLYNSTVPSTTNVYPPLFSSRPI